MIGQPTLFSMLLDSKNSSPLPQSGYVISGQGFWALGRDLDCRGMVCRHYTGPTRHRMYLSAYPFLLKQIRAAEAWSTKITGLSGPD